MSKYSQNIYIGDAYDQWRIKGYESMPIQYQVIPPGAKIEKETRSQIRQAIKNGVKIKVGNDDYYPCVFDTAVRQTRMPMDRYLFDTMRHNFGTITAWYEDECIAGCMTLGFNDRLFYVHSASKKKI